MKWNYSTTDQSQYAWTLRTKNEIKNMGKEWNNKPEKALLIYLIILAVLILRFHHILYNLSFKRIYIKWRKI